MPLFVPDGKYNSVCGIYFSMKYRRLTKQQLEELQPEFVNFLATQSITGEGWKNLKEEKPEVAEDEIDVFSDLIWEGVLNKVVYLENWLLLAKISSAP